MAAVAESLEPAITRRRPEDDAQRQRVVWNRRVAISYVFDTAFLFLFAMAGTISGGIPVIFGVISIAICAGNHVAIATGWNLKARDPSFTEQLTILSIVNHLGVVAVAPQIAFPFLVNLFTVFAVGMIWLSLRDSLVVWALGAAGVATMLYFVEGQIGIPTSTSFELLLVWAYFSLILGRCLLLSMHSNMLRARLASSRRELSASLEQVRTLASHDES